MSGAVELELVAIASILRTILVLMSIKIRSFWTSGRRGLETHLAKFFLSADSTACFVVLMWSSGIEWEFILKPRLFSTERNKSERKRPQISGVLGPFLQRVWIASARRVVEWAGSRGGRSVVSVRSFSASLGGYLSGGSWLVHCHLHSCILRVIPLLSRSPLDPTIMSSTAAPAPAAAPASPKPKASKASKAKASKPKTAAHAPYSDLIKRAIRDLGNRKGSSRSAILKHILQHNDKLGSNIIQVSSLAFSTQLIHPLPSDQRSPPPGAEARRRQQVARASQGDRCIGQLPFGREEARRRWKTEGREEVEVADQEEGGSFFHQLVL